MVRLAKWRSQQTVQSTWWLNNQQYAATYQFHFAPVPPTVVDTKREQAAAYQQEWEAAVSDNHDTSQALIQVDFSENPTCVAKGKIQGAHWEQH